MGLSVSILNSAWHEILIQKFSNMISCASISLKAWRPCLITGSSKESVSCEKNQPLATANLDGHRKMSCRNLCSSGHQKSNNMVLEKSHSIKSQVQERDPDGLCSLASNQLLHNLLLADSTIMPSPGPVSQLDAGVVKLQKVSKSYKTQRSLTYCGGVLEELWWKVLDFAVLKNSSVSFFNDHKQEAAVAKWARAKTRAAMVGKGLLKHDQAQKLALRYWLEAIDPHHRYGRNLHLYYDVWFKCESSQPFFYWLEIGDGKEVNLGKCPRSKLQQQRIKYLGMKGREAYEVIVKGGKLVYRQSGELLETSGDSKWIFVLSTSATLYVGRKRVGCFQHSSFIAGAATIFAGRLVAHAGVLEAIWPYSGHYLPTEQNFKEFISFLDDNNVDITKVKRYAYNDQGPYQVVEDDEEPVEKTTMIPASKQCKWEESVLRLAKQLHSKWTTHNGSKAGSNQSSWCAPVPGPSMNNGRMPSPRSSSTIYGSPSVAHMGVASPRALFASA